MKIMWLNDSLVLRAENIEERRSLAVVFGGIGGKEEVTPQSAEGYPKAPSLERVDCAQHIPASCQS